MWSPCVRWSQVAFLFHQPDICDLDFFFFLCYVFFLFQQGPAHVRSKPIFVLAVNIHSWWKVPRTDLVRMSWRWGCQDNRRHDLPTEEPQFKHQEVAGVAYIQDLCSSANLPTAAAHPEHSSRALFLEQMEIFFLVSNCVFLACR